MKMMQSIKGFFIKGNTIIQQLYKNEKLIDEYMGKVFEEIDELFEKQEYEIIEEKINDIYRKKQDRLSDKLEIRLLKYNCLLALVRNQNKKLDKLVSELRQYGENTEEFVMVKFNIAIFNKDNNLFNKLKLNWEKDGTSKEVINNNEIKFLYLTNQYEVLINKFNDEEYLTNPEFRIYVAKALSGINKFEEAKKILEKIKEDDDKSRLEYVMCLIKPILIKPRYLAESTNEEKLIFNECLKIMERIEITRLNKSQLKLFNYYKLQILLFNNKKLALYEIDNISEQFYNGIEFLVLKINIYNINCKYEKANEICDLLLERLVDEEDIISCIESIVNIKLLIKKWDDIIEIYNKYRKNISENQFVFYAYGISLIELYGEEHSSKIIEKECKTRGVLISLVFAMSNIKIPDKCEMYLSKAVNFVEKHDLILLDIIKVYEEIGKYQSVIDILEENYEYDIRFFKKYISIVINKNIDNKYRNVLEVYRKNYSSQYNEYVDTNVYLICVKNKNYRYAYYIASKLFKYKGNSYWKNEYVRMKLVNKEFSNLKQLAEELNSESDPKILITAGEAFLKLGEIDRAEDLVYKIAYNLENIDISCAIRITNLLLESSKTKGTEINSFDEQSKKAELNDIVILEDNLGGRLRICLNKEICYRSNTFKFGCLHIDEKCDLWIDLLGSKVNDTIEYKSEEYRIIEIVNKINYIGRICFEKRVTDNIENIETIKIGSDDDLADLKKKLKERNDAMQKYVDLYINKTNNTGLPIPINIISHEILKLEEVIEYLLVNNDTRFITGIPYIFNKGDNIVLTVLTVIFLHKYELLDDFIKYYNVYIPSSMISIFEDIINDLIMNFDKHESYLYYIEDNIIFDKKDESYKKIRIKKYKKILECLKQGTIISMNFSESILLDIPEEFLFTPDIEALEIAKKENMIVFVEDKFLYSICSQLYNIPVTNTAGFINAILFNDFKRFWSIVEKLIKGKYEYFFDYKTLALFILNYRLESKKSIKNFNNIISFILENDLEGFYRENLKNVCKQVFYLKLYPVMKDKVDIIMNKVNKLDNI